MQLLTNFSPQDPMKSGTHTYNLFLQQSFLYHIFISAAFSTWLLPSGFFKKEKNAVLVFSVYPSRHIPSFN